MESKEIKVRGFRLVETSSGYNIYVGGDTAPSGYISDRCYEENKDNADALYNILYNVVYLPF